MDLKELRTKSGLSQANFAKTIGVSASAVANIESGRMKASPKIIEACKNAYGEMIEPEDKQAKSVEKKEKPAAKKAKPTEKKAKPTAKKEKPADVKAEPVEVKAAPVKKKADSDAKKVKPAVKKAKPAAKAGKAAKKPAPAAKEPKQKKAVVIIQSPMGGEITPEDILAKVGKVEKVYVRVDVNKAYWVDGYDSGAVDLW